LAEGLASDGPGESERSILIEEVKIGCTLAMLQCLDRPHRLAYILDEILDLPGPRPPKRLMSIRACCASDLSAHEARSSRLHVRIVA
jgi:hypothetical protein